MAKSIVSATLFLPQLLITFAIQYAVLAEDSSFNLACGRRGNFTDSFGTEWIGDVAYLKIGQPAEISSNYASKFEALNTLRYFALNPPYNGIYYYFNLVAAGTTVTVTTQFYYGNYDGTSSPPTFYVQYDNYTEYRIKTSTGSNVSYTKTYATSNKTIFVYVFVQPGDWTTVPFVNTIQISGPGVNPGSYDVGGGNGTGGGNNSSGNKNPRKIAAIVAPIVVVLTLVIIGLVVCLVTAKKKKKNALMQPWPPTVGRQLEGPTGPTPSDNYTKRQLPTGTELSDSHGSPFSITPPHDRNYYTSNANKQYDPQGPMSWPNSNSTGSSDPHIKGGSAGRKTPFDQATRNVFSYAEILQITNNFGKQIGKGGSGVVYHGRLVTSNLEVAVKVLNESGTKEFVTEVQLLLTVHHKSIARFVGYCDEGQNLILVYEYMKGGNLRQLLSAQGSRSRLLTWDKRLQMATDVATGLDYLHSQCDPSIIHRDAKTTNILLNEKLDAKIADFGLSKTAGLEDQNVTYVSTVVAGTPGYLDPEYYNTGKLTRKSDVYSFGVVLFELISGLPAIITGTSPACNLVQWMKPLIERGDLAGIADPNLAGQYNAEALWKVALTAAKCTAESSNKRLTMADVVSQLKEAATTKAPQAADFAVPSATGHGRVPMDEPVP